jgi:hypothetical protein
VKQTAFFAEAVYPKPVMKFKSSINPSCAIDILARGVSEVVIGRFFFVRIIEEFIRITLLVVDVGVFIITHLKSFKKHYMPIFIME